MKIELEKNEIDLLIETLELREKKEKAVAASMRNSYYQKVSSEMKMNAHLELADQLRELQTKIAYSVL